MAMDLDADGGLSANRRRRMLQILFVFVNLALVQSHLPGPLWLAIGGAFWIALVLISATGSSLVCGTMCWVGALQDFAEPLARSRMRIDPRWGRGIVLALLMLWIPIGWYFWPDAAAHDRTPLDLDPNAWQRHIVGLSLALLVPLSVMLLGKRGICRFLCPFNQIVRAVRRFVRPTTTPALRIAANCARDGTSCTGCAGTVRTPEPQASTLLQTKGHHE